jgi:hypothetical protein
MQEKNIRDRIAKVQMLLGGRTCGGRSSGGRKTGGRMKEEPYCSKPYNPDSGDDMHILPYPESEDMATPPFNPEGGAKQKRSTMFVKGSPEAKAHMAKIRGMKGKGKLTDTLKKVGQTALKVGKVAVPLLATAYMAHKRAAKPKLYEIGDFSEGSGVMDTIKDKTKSIIAKIKKYDMTRVKKILKYAAIGGLTAAAVIALLATGQHQKLARYFNPADLPAVYRIANEIRSGFNSDEEDDVLNDNPPSFYDDSDAGLIFDSGAVLNRREPSFFAQDEPELPPPPQVIPLSNLRRLRGQGGQRSAVLERAAQLSNPMQQQQDDARILPYPDNPIPEEDAGMYAILKYKTKALIDKIKKYDMDKVKEILKYVVVGGLTATALIAYIASGRQLGGLRRYFNARDFPEVIQLINEIQQGQAIPAVLRVANLQAIGNQPLPVAQPQRFPGVGRRLGQRGEGGAIPWGAIASIAPVVLPYAVKGISALYDKIRGKGGFDMTESVLTKIKADKPELTKWAKKLGMSESKLLHAVIFSMHNK